MQSYSLDSVSQIFQSCPGLSVILLDAQGFVVDANAFACEILGESLDAVRGRLLWEMYPSTVASFRRALMDEVVESREVVRYEDSLHGDRTFEVSLIPLSGEDAGSAAVAFVAYDVTKRKVQENCVRTELDLLRVMAVNPYDALFVLDSRGDVLLANDAALALAGIEASALAGTPWIDFLPPETVQRRKSNLQHVIKRKVPCSFEMSAWEREWRGAMLPLLDGFGEVARISCTLRDVTELRGCQESLRQAHRALEDKDLAFENVLSLVDGRKSLGHDRLVADLDFGVRPALRRLRRALRSQTVAVWDDCKPLLATLEQAIEGLGRGFYLEARLQPWRLTVTEQRVCERIVAGDSLLAISESLGMALNTVKVHVKKIRKKLGISGDSISIGDHLARLSSGS